MLLLNLDKENRLHGGKKTEEHILKGIEKIFKTWVNAGQTL